jgi:hypothetical protein
MQLSNPKVLGISLLVGLGVAIAGGVIFALVAGRVLAHGIGTGLFVVGAVALVMGLLGATEPAQGWATKPGTAAENERRRSLAARVAKEHPDIEKVTSLGLAIWGIAVGGTLIALSMVAFVMAVP